MPIEIDATLCDMVSRGAQCTLAPNHLGECVFGDPPPEPEAPAKKLTARDLKEAIQSRYEPPEWHLEEEVTLAGRRLDVVALNLWGARAYKIVGFEIKVSRGDWLREIAAFQKAEEWTSVVDAFYVVTPPKMVKADELPADWGLLELCGSRLMTRTYPTVREGRTTIPREIAARFIGRLAKRDSEEARTAAWRARDEIRQDVEKRLRGEIEGGLALERQELEQLRKGYREILDVLGIPLNAWQSHERALRAAGIFADATRNPEQLQNRLRMIGEELARESERLLRAGHLLEFAGRPKSDGENHD